MSFVAEIEQTGVTIINKVEHFGSEVESRYLQYCVSRFQVPLFPVSNFVLDYSLNNDLSRDIYVCLSRYADGPERVIELNGTFSVVTSDGTICNLGMFFDQTLEINTVKEFKLKNLNSINCYEKEELFPNDVLILRCHIWNSEEKKRKSLKMCFISRCVIEKCCFKLSIADFEEKTSQDDYSYTEIIPWSLKAGSLKLIFHFKNFCSKNPDCTVGLYFPKNFWLYISYKITLECANGYLITFSENKNFLSMLYYDKHYLGVYVKTSELKKEKDFFYPNDLLHFICYFEFITERSIRTESIEYEEPRHSNSNQDCSAVSIEKNRLKEDQTLSDSLYSLYEEEKFCDVTLRIKHLLYPSHRAVLGARSDFFRTKFENNLKEEETATIDLDDDPQTLQMCLRYLYTDKIVASKLEDILQLFAMADKYMIPSLKKRCVTLLLSRMSVKHACEALIMADMHNADDLKKALEIFICKHAKEIINSSDWKILKDQFPKLALEIMDNFCNKVL